eukprot:468211-Prymnesium_polylepis.1
MAGAASLSVLSTEVSVSESEDFAFSSRTASPLWSGKMAAAARLVVVVAEATVTPGATRTAARLTTGASGGPLGTTKAHDAAHSANTMRVC